MPPSTTATERMMIPEETSFHYNGSIMLADSSDDSENNEEEDEYNPEDENCHPNSSRKKKKQVQMKVVVKQEQTKNMPDRRSLMKKQGSSSRRRRRSSARFLKISDTETVEDAAGGAGGGLGGVGSQSQLDTGDLGEVYRNAIRMNAENRINASNSWNLNLIDHLDQLVAPELRKGSKASRTLINGKKGRGSKSNTNTMMDSSMMNTSMHSMNSTSTVPGMPSTGVNFTKASCSLDASVKIYSYRVDDVHLTSYKVLANLNRTETNQTKSKKKNGATDGADAGATTEDGADGADADVGGSNGGRTTKSRGSGDTIEHNTANLNIHKLDAAFDIDPLFHKMSKNFDEGGAKGLLLANLGVGTSGCNIIFDSSLDTVDDDDNGEEKEGVEEGEEKEDGDPSKDADTDHTNSSNTVVDVTSLIAKLESLLISNGDNNGYSTKIGSIPLVPQLAALRSQFFDLDNDGFVDNAVSSQRYAASNEEEAEADKSIHLEAIERSRASQAFQARRGSGGGNTTLNSRDSYASNDGGGFDFGGGGDADADDFVDMHDGDHRFSSNSFQADATGTAARTSFSSFGNEYRQSFSPSSQQEQQPPPPSQASVLLDAIASGHISTTMESSNHYEYFNSQALANLSQGNLWAGAEHWKKMPSSSRRKTCGGSNGTDDTSVAGNKTPGKKKKGRKGKAVTKSTMEWSVAVHLNQEIEYNLDELLQRPTVAPPPKKKRGGKVAKAKVKADPLQVSKAMKTKYENNDNLLPIDAGLEVKEFTTLYGRPKTNLMDLAKARHEAAVAASSSLGKNRSTKMVGFGGVETWDGNDSYDGGGDDDGGAGFDFGGGGDDDHDDDVHDDNGDPNEFVVPELTDVRKIEKIKIGYAKIARKVDVKRLKRDLWTELERTFALKKAAAAAQHNTNTSNSNNDDGDGKEEEDVETNLSTASTVSDPDLDLVDTAGSGGDDKDVDNEGVLDNVAAAVTTTNTTSPSFQGIVRDMQQNQSQSDVTLPYYFICILHLCNEKELALESTGLDDFMIHRSLEDMQLQQQQQHDDDELSCVPRRPRR